MAKFICFLFKKKQECTTIVSTLYSFFDNDTKRNLRAFLQ